MWKKIKKRYELIFDFVVFLILIAILIVIVLFIIFMLYAINAENREKKENWEQTQIIYQCELKEVNTTTSLNSYTCKKRKDDTNIFSIENSFDLNSSDKAKLKNKCKIIGTTKMFDGVPFSIESVRKDLYELSCDNEKIRVITDNLKDFLAK